MIARLVVLRHGRTRWNATGRFQGQADPPLDQIGRRQAQQAAEAIARLYPQLIVSSDLRRARQTAHAVGTRCHLPVILDPRLREIDLGGWTGLTRARAARRYPGEYRQWRAGADIRRGGGESPADAGARAAHALLAALASAPPGAAVVAVAHGLVLQAAIRRLTDLGIAVPGAVNPHLPNAGWLVVPLADRTERMDRCLRSLTTDRCPGC